MRGPAARRRRRTQRGRASRIGLALAGVAVVLAAAHATVGLVDEEQDRTVPARSIVVP